MITPVDGLHGWRHLALDEVDSTNLAALRLANEGEMERLWITARRQTAGKARRGRSWISEPGNLYASLLLTDPAPASALATLPMVAALALHNAIVDVAPDLHDRLKIKWPNDLLLDGQKLSGILLEAQPDKRGRKAVIIGFGVNCRHYPDNSFYPATSLAAHGLDVAPDGLFSVLAGTMARELRIWSQGQGFSIIRREWLDRCSGIGEPIIARFPDHEIKGKFVDLDIAGLLILQDEAGHRHTISAADIFFGNSATMGA